MAEQLHSASTMATEPKPEKTPLRPHWPVLLIALLVTWGASVEMPDFDEAIDRMQLGARKKSRIMTDEEKRRVADHESGHALVALSLPHADPVHRVTIIPRATGALGATLQLPADDHYLVTREQLLDRLWVLVGGRTAEWLVLEDVSTGAAVAMSMVVRCVTAQAHSVPTERLGTRNAGAPVCAPRASPVQRRDAR